MKSRSPCIEPLEARIAPAFAAVFELSSLDGLNGFKISGEADSDYSGTSVSDAGDVNGDGFDDLLIGAHGADGFYNGASYVVFGKAGGFAANVNLSTLNGANGFKINGAATLDNFGFSVSGAGDVNGDGFDDLLIGALGADPNGSESGASYVVFGKGGAFSPTLNLSTLSGANGFKINGAADDRSGRSVSGAGDVNGDGFDDLLIGANGESYVVFGKAAGFAAAFNLSALNGANGFKIDGGYGYSVSGAGDVNGDGFDDLLIGVRGPDPRGASYVVFGKAAGFTAAVNLSTLDGANGFKINGVADRDYSGSSVSGAGDVNGDGFDDLLIGAPGADPNGDRSGASYVVFGKAGGFAPTFELSTLNGANGFTMTGASTGDRSGRSVSGAGDVNGDGFDDLLIGAYGADPNDNDSGASYVVFGKAGGFAPTLNLSTLNGVNGFKISGVTSYDHSGFSVSTAGDVNGDGFDDLLIGAPRADPNGSRSGASYVVFGSSNTTLSISDAAVPEGGAGTTNLTFTASLSGASPLPVTVRYRTQSGTAESGGDFIGVANELLTFAPGETSKSITIGVAGDTTHEADEALTVILSDPTIAMILDGTGTGTILNDDAAPLISITGGSVLEGDTGTSSFIFTVSLAGASELPASVQFGSADVTALAGSDYTALTPGTLTFAPGETSKTIAVEVAGDTSIEDHERFLVILFGASGATIGTLTATGTILNDDTTLRIAGPGDGLEGDSGTTPFVFTVSLEKASALPVTVNYATSDGTANAGSDFTAPPAGAQLSFAPGETSKAITIDVLGDTSIEDHESFSVALSGATNAALALGTAMGTILNDDTASALRISDATLLEGHSGTRAMTFTVSLTSATALPVSVNFTSADGTATSGTDYTPLTPGTLDFAPGETSKSIEVEVLGDIAVEASETFSIVLADATNAVIDDGAGLGTILDDDVTLIGKRKATFTDVDGDQVTIKVSKGTLKVEDFTIFPSGLGAQLALVDFSGETAFAGANLSIRAGAGSVDVGTIDASGVDLGKVSVKGDLGRIHAGNDADPKPGVRSLRLNSLGHAGIATQLAGGSLQSGIAGMLKSFKLAGGMEDATLLVSDGIGAITIKGSVARAQLLAGYDGTGAPVNADVSIGRVVVGGDWIASNLIAGVTAGPDSLFGTDDDAPISSATSITSKIASILIKGTAAGTEGGADHFGFVAEEIAAFKSGGVKLALITGPSNDLTGLPAGTSGDLRVREVA